MIETEVTDSLKAKYKNVHPLVFHRSVERAKSAGELFDILDTIPEYPIVWDEKQRRWTTTDNIAQSDNFNFPMG